MTTLKENASEGGNRANGNRANMKGSLSDSMRSKSTGESASSVRAPGRISKEGNAQLRRVLYMPAQVASRHEPNVRAFYEKLLARGKRPMVAVVAVMRKLLHSIYGMLKHGRDFDGEKFYQIPAQSA